MNNKRDRIIYLLATGLLSLMMLMSVGMYIFNHDEISKVFIKLSYPSYIIYPLAAAKILGLLAIWTKSLTSLKEWAYAGFFFDFLLAFFAHIMVNDGEHFGALLAMILLFTSYIYGRKLS